MSLERAILGKGSINSYFLPRTLLYPLDFIPCALCVAYSKISMFKRDLQQTAYLICHEKKGFQLLPDGQQDRP